MGLASGTRLGPYEIVAPIGAGGMGEVYKAIDTRLNRTVAVKVLPHGFAADAERRRRFEREARLIASLSHPHICALHDVGSQDHGGEALSYLVMEYLQGDTLAERLARGPRPLDDTLRIGAAIASALAAAHREGIVHRDLKPANVMLTRSGVKLLDFGIAKAVQDVGGAADAVPTKTLTMATAASTTLGTIPYMSPEQLEGRPVDSRSDIFALGAVLYEMATGRRAFPGESYAAVASSVLAADPPRIDASPALDRIVRTCLEKDPERRWQSAQDVALQLSIVREGDTTTDAGRAPRVAWWLPWGVAAAALALAAAAVASRWGAADAGRAAPLPGVISFAMPPPQEFHGFLHAVEFSSMAVSPDGAHLAFSTVTRNGDTRLWVRPLASPQARAIDGTEGATSMFWSPDSRSIAFFAEGKLKRVDLDGGAPIWICDARRDIGQSGTWGADGTILFASVQGEAILKASVSGATPVELIKPDPERNEKRVTWPSFLPDGRGFVYTATLADDSGTIMLAQAGSPPSELLRARSNAQYVDPGYLLFAQDASLVARRFDAETGEISGPPVAVADRVTHFVATGLAQFAASRSGVILYQSHANLSRVAWFDRSGKDLGAVRPPGGYQSLSLAPNRRLLLFDRNDPRAGFDIHLLEMDRGAETQITTEIGADAYPMWEAADSIIYMAARGAQPRLYRRSLSSGREQAIAPEGIGLQQPSDVSRDGKWLLYSQRSTRGDYDLHALRLSDLSVVPLRESAFNETDARFSPDGTQVAFVSNEGGRTNVYVMPFQAPGARRAVSADGGTLPRWSDDGRELFYLSVSPDAAHVTSAAISFRPALTIGTGRRLFPLPPGRRWNDYVPLPDGRFLAVQHVQFAGNQPLTVIANWSPTK